MAIDDDGDSTEEDSVELEAMREDSSWHPCQVSLSFTGVGLVVDLRREDVDNMILDKEDAIKQLRIRSVPLQGDDCSHIKEGDRVLATHASHCGSLFYDAEVEKAMRVRHSKRFGCRCTFTIKWIHRDANGASLTVPSSSILKLAMKCVKDHPTVAAFLSSLNGLNCCAVSPFPTVLEETDYDTNLQILLEKQVQDIDTNTSRKKNSEDILLKLDGDSKEEFLCKPDDVPKDSISSVQTSHEKNHIKKVSPIDMEEVKESQSAVSSIKEKHLLYRSHLSPLAARAALASFRLNLPHRLDFSVCLEEEKELACTPDNPIHKNVATKLLQESNAPKSCTEDMSVIDNLSSDTAAVTVAAVAEAIDILEPLMTTGTGFSRRQRHVKTYSGTLTRGRKNKQKMGITNSDASLTSSIPEELSPPSEKSASEIVMDDIGEWKISAVKMKSGPLTSVRRSARNTVKEENRGSAMEVRQELEESRSFQCMGSTPSEVVNRSNVPKKQTQSDHIEIDSSLAEERTKKRRLFGTGKPIQETHGKVSGTGTGSRKKAILASSKNQELRFSHRLKFLPRTRSQKRSKPQ